MPHPPRALLPLLLAAALAGCRSGPTDITARPAYPATRPAAGTLDIQVIRDGPDITLTNTTAQPLPPSTLWLNRRYAARLEGLPVGQPITIPLDRFIDAAGDPFRGGGFFATQRPERLAKAELAPDDPAKPLVSLIVVRGEPLR